MREFGAASEAAGKQQNVIGPWQGYSVPYDILRGCPFDRNEAASRIILNNAKHPGILASLSTGSRQYPVLPDSDTIPANEIRSRLNLQFQELCREAASVLGYALEEA